MLSSIALRSRLVLVSILIPSLCLLSSCALLINGTGQMVPIETEPVGVEVYLDGEFMGVTPLELDVSRGQSHDLLLKYGEQQREIKLVPEIAGGAIAADAIPVITGTTLTVVVATGGCSDRETLIYISCGDLWLAGTFYLVMPTAIISGISLAIDSGTGAIYTLSPSEVNEVFE